MRQTLLNKFRPRVMMFIALMSATLTGAWAQSVTFDASSDKSGNTTAGEQTITKDGITMTVSNGILGTDDNQYRIYKNQTLTISSAVGNITGIEFTCTASGTAKYGPGCFAEQEGYSYSDNVGTWSGSSEIVTFTASSNQVRATQIVVTYASGGDITPTCAAPTFSPAAGTFITAQSVEISTKTEDATIYYTIDGSDPTTESTAYTEAITVSETTTIKAIAVKAEYNNSSVASATYNIVSFKHEGTAGDPYTVADARLAIETGVGVSDVYATGIVSKIVTAYNSTYGNITYNISADGTTEGEQLQAFRGKGKDGEWFTSEYDVMVGDVVVIYGNLKKYNTTYEFDADNQLVSLERKPVEITIGEAGYATMYLPYAVECVGVLPSNDLPAPVGAWTFDDPANPLGGTGTATLTPANHSTSKPTWLETRESLEAAGIQVIDGGLYLPKGSSLLMNTNNGATGFDKYTVMFDISSDDLTGYTPLWQNSMQNAKDGSLFIKNGQVGLGGSLGYNGQLNAGQWYRVVLVIDTPHNAALYIDGELLSSCDYEDPYNKHWLLPEPGAVFFADEDGEEKDIKVTGLRFWDVPFTANQVAALGTVDAEPEVEIVKVPEATGVWTFDNVENLTAGTGVATMTTTSGVVAGEDGSVTVGVGDNLQITTNLPEESLDSYTLMMDVKFPDVARYTAIIQTDLDNVNDAGLFVHNGQVGINTAGMGYHGALENDTWYRLVFVVNGLIASEYIDGVLVGKASAAADKWGIGTGFFLFEDEDADNDEGIATTTEIRFWNQALTPAQVALLSTVGTEPNLKAYTGVVNSGYLALTEINGIIPALTPVVLKAAPNTYAFNLAENVAPIEENDLKGTLEDIDAVGKYVLAQPEGEQVGFYLANGGTIAAGKAYLEGNADVKAFYFGFADDATGIESLTPALSKGEGAIYKQGSTIVNLAGQRLNKMQKGINIMNGKKILK